MLIVKPVMRSLNNSHIQSRRYGGIGAIQGHLYFQRLHVDQLGAVYFTSLQLVSTSLYILNSSIARF